MPYVSAVRAVKRFDACVSVGPAAEHCVQASQAAAWDSAEDRGRNHANKQASHLRQLSAQLRPARQSY